MKRTKIKKCHAKEGCVGRHWRAYLPALTICVAFLIIGILFAQNEIYQDDWYIEASADGFFGKDNRSLFTLGPNFIVLGLIWLLSLTGIRLFWLHIILVVTNFLSHVLLSVILTERLGKWAGAFLSILVGLIMAPIVSFEFQFTTTAAFALASGCAALFDCADRGITRGKLLAGFGLAIFGSCLRFDCVAYCALTFGLLILYRLYKAWKIDGCQISKAIRRWIAPFACLALISIGLGICQRVGMEIENPGFMEWNSGRTRIDDYEQPVYGENEKAYEEMGLSQNDYNLMLSWNYQDPSVFSEDIIESLTELKNNSEGEAAPNLLMQLIIGLKEAMRTMLGSISFWSLLVLSVPLLLAGGTDEKNSLLLLLIADIIFLMFFKSIGRLIWRTEWPIWITSASVLVILYRSDVMGQILKLNNMNKVFCCCIVLFALLLVKPYKAPESMYEIYKNRALRGDTYLSYLVGKVKGEKRTYATYDEEAALYLSNQKDKMVYALWQDPWLQQYPLYARDTFTFFDEGSGSNFASLGQYFIELTPVKKIIEGTGTSSFERLLSPTSLIVVRNDENVCLLNYLSTYIEEHYQVQCVFSVQKIINDVIIGRFVDPNTIAESSQMQQEQIIPEVSVCVQNDRFIEIDYSESDLSECDPADVYIEICGTDGKRCLATPMEGESRALIYKGSLLPGEYQVKLIMRSGSDWIPSSSLTMEIV